MVAPGGRLFSKKSRKVLSEALSAVNPFALEKKKEASLPPREYNERHG
jgi:hypothetical protein